MIKIKSKNVDTSKLDKIQEEFQAEETGLYKLSCDGTEEGLKKYNEERSSLLDKLRGIKIKYIKEFYKLFDGHCVKISSQGTPAKFFEFKDVKIKKVKGSGGQFDGMNRCCLMSTGESYSIQPGNSRSVGKGFLTESNKQGNRVPVLFWIDKNYGPATIITEITKKEFEEHYKTAIPIDIPREIESKLIPWQMNSPRPEFEKLEDMKRLHVELTLANTSVLLAKERIKNLCLYQNMAKDVAECKDKKLKTCMHKQFLVEIEKSDKKIETFERRIEKNKESLEKKLYLVKKDNKKS